jgi:hypothetical protein
MADPSPSPVLALGVAALIVGGGLAYVWRASPPPAPAASSVVTARPSATLLVAVRDLARLETTELHFEKVVDLTDTQSRFFGLVQGTDALLLVAAGNATIGVDLGRIEEGDLAFDPETHRASLALDAPDVLEVHLDEERTYVYSRATSLVARRNEHLEARARQEAVAAMTKAAREPEVIARAKRQAERELRALAVGLGARDLVVAWRDAPTPP